MSILARFPKQPVDVLDYDINFTEWLDDKQDTIASVVATVEPTGLILEDTAFNGGIVKVFTSGGTSGVTYKISVTITTTGGRVKQVEIGVKVKEI